MDFPKSIPGVGLVNDKFVDENPTSGVIGSLIPAVWGNAVTTELLNVILAGGLTPSEADTGQLAKAIAALDTAVIAAIRGGASTSFDQLSKVAAALNNNPKFGQDVVLALSQLASKADVYTKAQTDQKDTDTIAAIRGGVSGDFDQLSKVAAALSQLASKADVYTKAQTDQRDTETIAAVRGGVSASFDQLSKVATALNNDPQFAATVVAALAVKATKSTTLAGYGINDSYTAAQIDAFLGSKISVGAYGLGGYCPVFPSNNLNTQYDGTSWFRTTTGCLNCPPGANPQGSLVFHQVWGLGVAQQTFREHVTAREWHRACNAYEFGPWVEVVRNMVGAIQAFACTTAPTGWLVADGSQVLRANYPALLAVTNGAFGWGNGTTTFNLPDMRGETIRGLDLGRGINPGRAMGSVELDALQGHGHANSARVTGQSGGAGEFLAAGSEPLTTSTNRVLAPVDLAGYGSVRVASETRSRNVALLYCIKY